jgi:hypothetical protein
VTTNTGEGNWGREEPVDLQGNAADGVAVGSADETPTPPRPVLYDQDA